MRFPLILLSTTALATGLSLPHLRSLSPLSHDQSPIYQPTMVTTTHISEILSLTKRIRIFAGLTRDVDSVAARLDSGSERTTLLAPTDSALTGLPRKPWEDPDDYERLGTQAYSGDDGAERAARNLARFVGAHVVPAAPWKEGQKVRSMAGVEVWWEQGKDGERKIMPGNIEVVEVTSKAGNGEVWIVKGTMNYPTAS